MAVLLATLAALAYGLSDFVGGLASRRASAWAVALLGQLAATVGTLVVASVRGGNPTLGHFAWAGVAGISTAVGTVFLYRGLAAGRMGVVAPVSAVGAALVPVAVGAASGERPGLVVWLGIVAALPGIWLVASEPPSSPPSGSPTHGLLDGVIAGLGFGAFFAALAQIPDTAGLWPVAVAQASSVLAIVVLALMLGARWFPPERGAAWGVVAGLLGATAGLLFLLSTHHGYLTVAGVITSLYPAGTVLLAATLLRERIHLTQGAGLALCAAAVGLVAAG